MGKGVGKGSGQGKGNMSLEQQGVSSWLVNAPLDSGEWDTACNSLAEEAAKRSQMEQMVAQSKAQQAGSLGSGLGTGCGVGIGQGHGIVPQSGVAGRLQ